MANQWRKSASNGKAKMLKVVKSTIKVMSKDIVSNAPVDTSLFKSTLYASINAPYESVTVDAGHGITEVANSLKLGDTYYFTSSQPYAIPLEYGHSGQAPNGMFRLAIAKFPFSVNKVAAQFISSP